MESSGRTLVCSVLFLDIVEYSKKPVSEQLQLKQEFNRVLTKSLEPVPARDRIILDTGDGAAVTFMGDPAARRHGDTLAERRGAGGLARAEWTPGLAAIGTARRRGTLPYDPCRRRRGPGVARASRNAIEARRHFGAGRRRRLGRAARQGGSAARQEAGALGKTTGRLGRGQRAGRACGCALGRGFGRWA